MKCESCGRTIVVAKTKKLTRVVAEGKTFEGKGQLKGLGFQWDSKSKEWFRDVADEEIDKVCEFTNGRVEGVTCRTKA